METKTFLMMGRPGSGKGTQAKLLAEKLGFEICSSGNWFRSNIASGSFLGARMQETSNAGYLMPWWIAAFIYEDKLLHLEKEQGVIFEGACRTLPEAQLFHEVLEWLGRPYRVFYLDISGEETIKRLSLRAAKEERPDDSGVEKFKLRISEFENKTMPSAEYLKSVGRRTDINGEQTPEAVFRDIEKALRLLP